MQLFVDNLTNVDFSYLDSQRGMLGETWLANIELDGKLDEQGMVCDFGTVKKTLRNWLDDELDHRLAVPIRSDQLRLQENGDQISIEYQYGDGLSLTCSGPRQAFALVEATELTPTSIAKWCISQLTPLFPSSIEQLRLDFSLENILGVHYHYSHGLKKHLGNCQRIAHGHRSTLMIWKDTARDAITEQAWAEKWRDIYIGSLEDITRETESHYHFGYRSQQGAFELSTPKQQTYIIDTDTTVELLASHIANTLKHAQPNHTWKVRAFEGIGKGAIVER